MVRPTFGSGQLHFERSGSSPRSPEAGIHSGGAQEFYSSGFGESYLNEISRANPPFTINKEVEPPEGAIPLKESDVPVFIGDLQGVECVRLTSSPGETGCH